MAVAANREKTEKVRRENTQPPQLWELTIQGEIKNPPRKFNWSQLETLSSIHVKTTSPHNTENLQQVFDFQGILLSQILKQAEILPTVEEITLLGFDGYRATIQLSDLNNYPIILALKRDGKPIPRSEGGPLYTVLPQTEFPRLKQDYSDGAWVFYVTHIIAGTEPPALKIRTSPRQTDSQIPDHHKFDVSDLEEFTPITLYTQVGYERGWPVGFVQLEGIPLRDIFQAAGIPLTTTGSIVIRGKSAIDRDATTPIRLDTSLILNCDIVIVRRWGNPPQPISAHLGGPLTLALPPECTQEKTFARLRDDERYWITFVEELELN